MKRGWRFCPKNVFDTFVARRCRTGKNTFSNSFSSASTTTSGGGTSSTDSDVLCPDNNVVVVDDVDGGVAFGTGFETLICSSQYCKTFFVGTKDSKLYPIKSLIRHLRGLIRFRFVTLPPNIEMAKIVLLF